MQKDPNNLARLFMELLVLNGELFSLLLLSFSCVPVKILWFAFKGKTVCAGTTPSCLFKGNTIFPSFFFPREQLDRGWHGGLNIRFLR